MRDLDEPYLTFGPVARVQRQIHPRYAQGLMKQSQRGTIRFHRLLGS